MKCSLCGRHKQTHRCYSNMTSNIKNTYHFIKLRCYDYINSMIENSKESHKSQDLLLITKYKLRPKIRSKIQINA